MHHPGIIVDRVVVAGVRWHWHTRTAQTPAHTSLYPDTLIDIAKRTAMIPRSQREWVRFFCWFGT